jgi:PiT family inorganic phosphate transporter
MDSTTILVIVVVGAALAFDFINGFHDAANSIATLVSTRVLTPQQAVAWAAFFNFVSFAVFELHVASTIGKGIIDPSIVDAPTIIGALTGAIIWNLLTWYWGLPSSSSHALVGGLVGAGVCKGGLAVLGWQKITMTLAFIVVSPAVGLVAAATVMVGTSWLLRKKSPAKVNKGLKPLRFASAAWYSLGHGANDAQKTMGIIVVFLFSQGLLGAKFPEPHEIPFWIVFSCHGAMGLGTLFGGWRIVKTMGMRLTKLGTHGAFSAEVGGAVALTLASEIGIPVSTTHTITGAIVGAGVVSGTGRVRWALASRIVWAWIFTIPAAAIMSALAYYAAKAILGG